MGVKSGIKSGGSDQINLCEYTEFVIGGAGDVVTPEQWLEGWHGIKEIGEI